MSKFKKISVSFVLSLVMLLNWMTPALAAVDDNKLEDAINSTAEYIRSTVRNPQVGSIGGEWAVLGLARSGYDVPKEYYQKYYATVESYVKSLKGNLHDKNTQNIPE